MYNKKSHIPKVIHYCWFGPKKMSLASRMCIASWHYFLPNYRFILWNENNFDIHSHEFTKQAYLHKKYAFVSDYVRMYALKKEGEIYLDTDVEVLQSFDSLINYNFFIGLEGRKSFGSSVIGAKKDHWLPNKMLNIYDKLLFDIDHLKKIINVPYITNLLNNYGFSYCENLENIDNQVTLPLGSFGCGRAEKNKVAKASHPIYARHLFLHSWRSPKKSIMSELNRYIFKGRLKLDLLSLIRYIQYKRAIIQHKIMLS